MRTVQDNSGRNIDIAEALRLEIIDEVTARALVRNAAKRLERPADFGPSESIQMVVKTTNLIDQLGATSMMYEESASPSIASPEPSIPEEIEPFEGRLSFRPPLKLGLMTCARDSFETRTPGGCWG